MLELENLDIDGIAEACTPYQSFYEIQSELSWSSMDDDWKQTLIERGNGWWIKGVEADGDYDQGMMDLKETLLSIAGESVCFAYYEEDLFKILSRGILWSGNDVAMMPGSPSQCHSNSAACWDANRQLVTIATGYALSYSGGMWRQHSWCIGLDDEDRGPYVIETTEPRVAYFGFPMTYDECDLFLYENW